MKRSRTIVTVALGVMIVLVPTASASANPLSTSEKSSLLPATPDAAGNKLSEAIEIKAAVRPGAAADRVSRVLNDAGLSDVRLRFAGTRGVAEYQVPYGAAGHQIAEDVSALFDRVHATVQPLEAVTVTVPPDSSIGVAAVSRALGDLAVSVEQHQSTPAKATKAPQTAPAQTAVANDWPTYFPSFWRGEMSNVNRCVGANGDCDKRYPVAAFNFGIKWGDNGHSPAAWPDADWGLEVGMNLYAPQNCIFDPAGNPWNPLGWWAKASNYTWVTDLPANSAPYLDDNRASDVCERLAVAFGVGYPRNVNGPTGYRYTFYIEQDRGPQTSSKVSADYQAISNDCNNIGRAPDSDCMGLNTGRAFPYGPQSATLVSSSRNWTVPACFAMRDQWAAPVNWANGTSKLLPAPLNYYDSCIANT